MLNFLKCMMLAYLAITFVSLDLTYVLESSDHRVGFLLAGLSVWAIDKLSGSELLGDWGDW